MVHAAKEVEYAVNVGAVDPVKSGSIRSVSRFAVWMAYATAAATTSSMPAWFFPALRVQRAIRRGLRISGLTHRIAVVGGGPGGDGARPCQASLLGERP